MLEFWNSKAPYSVLGEFDVSAAATKTSYVFLSLAAFERSESCAKGKI